MKNLRNEKCTPADSVFDGPLTNLLSTLCVLTELLLRVHTKGEKGLNNFKLGTFSGRFPSYDAASMAMKGLIDAACITHIVYRL